MFVCICVCTFFVCVYVCMYVCVCVFVCVYVCVDMCTADVLTLFTCGSIMGVVKQLPTDFPAQKDKSSITFLIGKGMKTILSQPVLFTQGWPLLRGWKWLFLLSGTSFCMVNSCHCPNHEAEALLTFE